MTTFQPTPFLSDVLSGERIPEGKLAYFRARLSNRLHELVLSAFLKLEQQQKISKASLAKRLGRKPEQISRWLGAPGNWTIETFSDLLLGMGVEPAFSIVHLNPQVTAKMTETREKAAIPTHSAIEDFASHFQSRIFAKSVLAAAQPQEQQAEFPVHLLNPVGNRQQAGART